MTCQTPWSWPAPIAFEEDKVEDKRNSQARFVILCRRPIRVNDKLAADFTGLGGGWVFMVASAVHKGAALSRYTIEAAASDDKGNNQDGAAVWGDLPHAPPVCRGFKSFFRYLENERLDGYVMRIYSFVGLHIGTISGKSNLW